MNNESMLTRLDGAIPTLKRVGKLYWNSGTIRLFFKLALMFVIPATAIVIALVYAILYHRSPDSGLQHLFWYYVTILGSQSLVRASLGAMAQGAIAIAVAELYLHRQPRWLPCLQKSFNKLFTLVVTGVIAEFFAIIGFAFFYIPGLLLQINFIITTPVIVLENDMTILSSLVRSWSLTKGHRWYIFKCMFSLDLLYYLVSFLLRILLKTDDNTKPFLSLTFHLLIAIPNSVFIPAYGILKTVMYLQFMVLKENLDDEKLANQIDHEADRVPLLADQDVEVTIEAASDQKADPGAETKEAEPIVGHSS